MATQAEQRWIDANRGLAQSTFGTTNPADGLVGQFIQNWYSQNPGSQADAIDGPILQELSGSKAVTTNPNPTNSTNSNQSVLSSDIDEALAELRLDPDFAKLPDNWQREIAQIAITQGLAVAAQNMAANATAPGQDPSFAGERAALARWAGKANEQVKIMEEPETNLPLEQDLMDRFLPQLLADAEADKQRRALADRLGTQATTDFDAARNALSPEENARRLAEELAQADQTTGAISSSAATAGAEQLAALKASIESMRGNLVGDLANKSTILANQVDALIANLGTLDETQKAALTEQIAATKNNLETSIAAQKQNLTTEVAALRGAADANSVARRQALEQEIAGLTAAQLPLNQARLDSANAMATGINLGLQNTTDQLTAQRAKQGYLGGSSFDQANLARAAIGARQNAAQVMGGAREENAADMRTIGARGATEGRSLADQYANDLLSISGREATGGRTLSDTLAQGTQVIGDAGATGLATIKNNTGLGLANINNTRANQYFADQTKASTDLRSLLDSLAKGEAGVSSNTSIQQQAARDQGTTAKQGYFDNAYTRGQGAILSRPGLSSQLTQTLTGLDNYGSTGLNRALNTLNWWSSNGQAAPTTGYVPVTASNTGNDIAGLGAGLLGAGLNIGNANSWWQKPKTASSTGLFGGGQTDLFKSGSTLTA